MKMSKIPDRGKNCDKSLKFMGNHNEFLSRIRKTLYYGKLPKTDRLSLPVSELASELFSEAHKGHSLERLYCDDASSISRNACVSPCSFVLALLYLERLKDCNPEYLKQVIPSKLFLISLMISSKFLHDDGEEDEVFIDEWAKSGEISVPELCQLEKEFLNAINWNVFVREPIFWDRLEKLETAIALREGSKREWLTYTELKYLINLYEFKHIINTLVTVSAVLALTYAVSVVTIAGSVFLTSHIPGTSLHFVRNQQNDNTILSLISNQNITGVNYTNNLKILPSDVTFENTKTSYKTSDALNVIQASLLLVSISCNNGFSSCDTNDNFNNNLKSDCSISTLTFSWDWWNNPIMNWLTDISRTSTIYEGIKLPDNYYKNFAYNKLMDMSIANEKLIHLEDKIHKATKVRLQDQMERSWHEEWTDTLLMTLAPFFNEISAY